jgi:SAM-dependent methyltransferase
MPISKYNNLGAVNCRSGKLASDEAAKPNRLLEIGFAFRKSKILLSAVELDVFTALDNGPADCDALAERVQIHRRGARDFFDALVSLQLLNRDAAGRYSNAPDCDRYLNRHSADFVGGLFRHLNGRMYGIWGRLSAALCSGLPQSGALGDEGYDALYANQATLDEFVQAMSASSLLPARAIAVGFPWHKYASFFDVGTAQGCVPVEIARVNPHLTGGGFDLPAVERSFTAYVSPRGLGDRLKFRGGDFLKDDLPSAGVLIMGRILHNWSLDTKRLLLNKAYRALPPGGALIVYDPMRDEARTNSDALLAGLTMLLETREGFEYTANECRSWMKEAGFIEMQLLPLEAGYLAVIGHKQDH